MELNAIPGAGRYKLNVIYFIGNDREPIPGYRRRLSELLLYLQQFYGKEMARNGFGFRSVALPMDSNGEVDITLVRGKRPACEYTNSEQAAIACLEELDAYYQEHPEQRRSGHCLIIMPTQNNAEFNDSNPGGVPVFGMGHDCFTLDYADFDLQHLGAQTDRGLLLTKMFGGFAHELGHCMALPHNNGPVSELKKLALP